MKTKIFCVIGEDAAKIALLLTNMIVRYNFAIFPSGEEWKYFSALEQFAKGTLNGIPSGFSIRILLPFQQHQIIFFIIHLPAFLTQTLLYNTDAFLLCLPENMQDAIKFIDDFIRVAAIRMFPFFWRRRVLKPVLIFSRKSINIYHFTKFFKNIHTINISQAKLDFSGIFDEKTHSILAVALQWLGYVTNLRIHLPV